MFLVNSSQLLDVETLKDYTHRIPLKSQAPCAYSCICLCFCYSYSLHTCISLMLVKTYLIAKKKKKKKPTLGFVMSLIIPYQSHV